MVLLITSETSLFFSIIFGSIALITLYYGPFMLIIFWPILVKILAFPLAFSFAKSLSIILLE